MTRHVSVHRVVLILLIHVSSVQTSCGFIGITAAKKPGIIRQALLRRATVDDEDKDDGVNGGDNDGESKKKRKPTARRHKSTEPSYWHDEDDPFLVVTREHVHATGGGGKEMAEERHNEHSKQPTNEVYLDNRKIIKFTIRGNPRVLIRHRTARGFMYNPSRASQDQFRDCLLKLLPRRYHPTIIDDECFDGGGASSPVVLFSQEEFLKMSLVFRMKRPKSHFVGNKPGPGRLKPAAPGKLHSSRGDVDNLAKFVMDSLNGLVYSDDRQVISLNAIKVLDSEEMCQGATEVEISVLTEEDF